MIYVIRTHEGHWDNDCVVAKFISLSDAIEYIGVHIERGDVDCLSISVEEESNKK